MLEESLGGFTIRRHYRFQSKNSQVRILFCFTESIARLQNLLRRDNLFSMPLQLFEFSDVKSDGLCIGQIAFTLLWCEEFAILSFRPSFSSQNESFNNINTTVYGKRGQLKPCKGFTYPWLFRFAQACLSLLLIQEVSLSFILILFECADSKQF